MRLAALCALPLCTGCFTLYNQGVDRSLAYRSPLGIRVDLTRNGTPIAADAFERLVPGESSLAESLATLGAPHRVRRTAQEETLEYYYVYDRKTRLLVRPLFFLTYGDLASYNYRGSETGPDVVALVFNHGGTLLRKELRRSAPDRSTGATLRNVFVP